jgi:ribosomal protein L18E
MPPKKKKAPVALSPTKSPLSSAMDYKLSAGPAGLYKGKMRSMKSGEQTGVDRDAYDLTLMDAVKGLKNPKVASIPSTQYGTPSSTATKELITQMKERATESKADVIYTQANISKGRSDRNHANMMKIVKPSKTVVVFEPNGGENRSFYDEQNEFNERVAKALGYSLKVVSKNINSGYSCAPGSMYMGLTDMHTNPHSVCTPSRLKKVEGLNETERRAHVSPILRGITQLTAVKKKTRLTSGATRTRSKTKA